MKKEYTIILGTPDTIREFEQVISQNLNDGWSCQGGICAMLDPNGNPAFFQAMIKG